MLMTILLLNYLRALSQTISMVSVSTRNRDKNQEKAIRKFEMEIKQGVKQDLFGIANNCQLKINCCALQLDFQGKQLSFHLNSVCWELYTCKILKFILSVWSRIGINWYNFVNQPVYHTYLSWTNNTIYTIP